MAKNEREVCRLDYMDRWYPLVATGLVQITVDEFLKRYKQYISEMEAYNHVYKEDY